MKNAFGFCAVALLLALAACKDTDNAAKWVGTYKGTGNGTKGNNFNQVVIEESNSTTIRISADTALPSGAVYTYSTIQHGNVQSATAATFNETDSVLGFTHPLLLSGNISLNGNTILFVGTGISAYDTISYYFFGTKQ